MLKRFFILCSGADQDLLALSTPSSQVNQASIGAAVFFTAIMAFLASSYALYTVFDHLLLALGCGVLWALLIFNLDRFIVSTMRKSAGQRQLWLQALPRLAMALLIAIVISKPLELRLFEKEIDQALLTKKHQLTLQNQDQVAAQFESEIKRLTQANDELHEALQKKEVEVNELYQAFISEAEGTGGSMKLGKGPVYAEKRAKHDAAQQELIALRTESRKKMTANSHQLEELYKAKDKAVEETQPIVDGFDGLLARLEALQTLAWWPRTFIFLLFVFVESAPVLVKLLSPESPYDVQLENMNHAQISQLKRQLQERKAAQQMEDTLRTQAKIRLSEEEDLIQEQERQLRELLKQRSQGFA